MIKIEQGTYRYHTHSVCVPDITVRHGECIGLRGVSGSGKSTIGKILTGQLPYHKHKLHLPRFQSGQANPVQWVGQQCEFAFNPRWTIERSLKEAYRGHNYTHLMEQFELEFHWQFRVPQALSGGQLQRFNLVRALTPTTKFLICDEATDQLDTIAQQTIWRTIQSERNKRQLGLLIISHQIPLLNVICDHIVDMPTQDDSNFSLTKS